MNEQLMRFLAEIDRFLASVAQIGEQLDVYHLGRSALVMHFGFPLTTADVDIVHMRASPLEQQMIDHFARGTVAASTLGLYLDPVPMGLPPLPGWFRSRSELVAGDWKVLRLWRLEVHDLAASKMKSFRPQDREDLQSLCDRGLIQADKLRLSLEQAFLWDHDKDGDPARETAFTNLARVESYLVGAVRSL